MQQYNNSRYVLAAVWTGSQKRITSTTFLMLAVIASAYAVDFLIIRGATSVALTGVPAIKRKK